MGDIERQGCLVCCSPWGRKRVGHDVGILTFFPRLFLYMLFKNIEYSSLYYTVDFVGYIFLFLFCWFFWPHCTAARWILIPHSTRDWTHTPCSGSAESYPLDCQGSPWLPFSFCMIPFIWNVQNRKIHRDRKQVKVCLLLWRGNWEWLLMGMGWQNVLK